MLGGKYNSIIFSLTFIILKLSLLEKDYYIFNINKINRIIYSGAFHERNCFLTSISWLNYYKLLTRIKILFIKFSLLCLIRAKKIKLQISSRTYSIHVIERCASWDAKLFPSLLCKYDESCIDCRRRIRKSLATIYIDSAVVDYLFSSFFYRPS